MNPNKFTFDSDKILAALSPDERQEFLSYGKKLSFKQGQLVFYEGGIATGIFLIEQGKAKIFNVGIYGKQQIFYIYKQHDLLGYHALLCNEPYEDSCEALEDCEVLFINKTDFNLLLDTIPNLKLLFIQNMSHEFGVLVNTITILAQRSLRERLALYLIILQERYFDPDSGQSIILLPREDLANVIGTTRESLGRILKDFKEEQLIKINKRAIEIENQSALLKIANT